MRWSSLFALLIISIAGCKPTTEAFAVKEMFTVTVAPTNSVHEEDFVSVLTGKGANVDPLNWNHTVSPGQNRLLVAFPSLRLYYFFIEA